MRDRGVVADDDVVTDILAERLAQRGGLVELRRQEAVALAFRQQRIDASEQSRPERRRGAGAAAGGPFAVQHHRIPGRTRQRGDVGNHAAVDAALVERLDPDVLPFRPRETRADAAAGGAAPSLAVRRTPSRLLVPDALDQLAFHVLHLGAADGEHERTRRRKGAMGAAVVLLVTAAVVAGA